MAAAEQKKSYAVVKNFTSLNTKANRTAIKEDEFAWIENAMPIGHGNIKIVPSQNAVRDSGNAAVAFANTVTSLESCNLALSDYILAFEDNGRGEYYKLDTATTGNSNPLAACNVIKVTAPSPSSKSSKSLIKAVVPRKSVTGSIDSGSSG